MVEMHHVQNFFSNDFCLKLRQFQLFDHWDYFVSFHGMILVSKIILPKVYDKYRHVYQEVLPKSVKPYFLYENPIEKVNFDAIIHVGFNLQ